MYVIKALNMKRRIVFIVAAVFVAWNIVTWYIVYSQLSSKSGAKDIHEKIVQLENKIQAQVKSNKQMFQIFQQQKHKLDILGDQIHLSEKLGKQDDKATDDVVSNKLNEKDSAIAVLVFACNRPSVSRNLDQLFKYRSSESKFPIVVSQDCGDKETANMIKQYANKLTFIQHPDLSEIHVEAKDKKFLGYYKIARHYRWALNYTFNKLNYNTVIVVEDDLNISPDFFEYFSATYKILNEDPSLWCVSAWNDNGKPSVIANDPELLHRTDFFPGLGWMMKKEVWLELEPKWPIRFWDDWMRHPEQRKNRVCIRPEISRTSTFGRIGVSKGQYFDAHLKHIKLNTEFIEWTKKDLSYLKRDAYDKEFTKTVYSCPDVGIRAVQAGQAKNIGPAVRVTYNSRKAFVGLAKSLGVMFDVKAGVPRTGYMGVVSLIYNGQRVYLAPPSGWEKYDESWS